MLRFATTRISWINVAAVVAAVGAVALIALKNRAGTAEVEITNVSYDPTRELYQEINSHFRAHYYQQTGKLLTIRQSHGGSSHQARLVASGQLHADVVTLGLPSDIGGLEKRGLVASGWADRLPNHSQPYYSTIVFVVRRGNPNAIRDWPDLLRPGIEIITPDPRTSGNGKLTALAAWGAIVTRGGSDAQARDYLRTLYERTPFLLPAARAAATAFAVEGVGDVHLVWENEALREAAESGGKLEIAYPPVSIRAEPAVAWLEEPASAHHNTELARAYLEYLFTEEAQEIIARAGYRPFKADVLKRHAERLPPITLFPITSISQGWEDAQQKFFAEHGIIEAVSSPKPR